LKPIKAGEKCFDYFGDSVLEVPREEVNICDFLIHEVV
jgi:hypothetical protein